MVKATSLGAFQTVYDSHESVITMTVRLILTLNQPCFVFVICIDCPGVLDVANANRNVKLNLLSSQGPWLTGSFYSEKNKIEKNILSR